MSKNTINKRITAISTDLPQNLIFRIKDSPKRIYTMYAMEKVILLSYFKDDGIRNSVDKLL